MKKKLADYVAEIQAVIPKGGVQLTPSELISFALELMHMDRLSGESEQEKYNRESRELM